MRTTRSDEDSCGVSWWSASSRNDSVRRQQSDGPVEELSFGQARAAASYWSECEDWNVGWQEGDWTASETTRISWREQWRHPQRDGINIGRALRKDPSCTERCMVFQNFAIPDTDARTVSSSSSTPAWTSRGSAVAISPSLHHSKANDQWWSGRGWMTNGGSVDEPMKGEDWCSYQSWFSSKSEVQSREGEIQSHYKSWSFEKSWDPVWQGWNSYSDRKLFEEQWSSGRDKSDWNASWESGHSWSKALVDDEYFCGDHAIHKLKVCFTRSPAAEDSIPSARTDARECAPLLAFPRGSLCASPGISASPFMDRGVVGQPVISGSVSAAHLFEDGHRWEFQCGLTPSTDRTPGSKVRASSLSVLVRPTSLPQEAANPWANFSSTRSVSFGRSLPCSSARRALSEDSRASRASTAARMAVMLEDAVELLMQGSGPDATYADCTFGRGGHASEILRRLSTHGRLLGFDIDPVAIAAGRVLEQADTRFTIHHRPHGDLSKVIDENDANLGGVLIDLGSHTTQEEDRNRGFSVVDDGPLDLRLNREFGIPASEWLQTVSVQELAWVIHEHGEDNDAILSMRLAEGILERQRCLGPYTSSLQLADVCRDVKQGIDDRGQHPAKLTFQAIRAFLNHEVEQLDLALHGAMQRLQQGGRCVVITYKRKEAAQVKRFLREHEEADPRFAGFVTTQRLVELYPLLATDLPWSCRQSCEPVRASAQECESNPRARSALVHVLTKQERDFTQSPHRDLKPRPESVQFKKPAPLPFEGGLISDTEDFSSAASLYGSVPLAVPVAQARDHTNSASSQVDALHVREHVEYAKDIVEPVEPVPIKDWLCPQCGDLQWARRPRCRLCGCAPHKHG